MGLMQSVNWYGIGMGWLIGFVLVSLVGWKSWNLGGNLGIFLF